MKKEKESQKEQLSEIQNHTGHWHNFKVRSRILFSLESRILKYDVTGLESDWR